jgi:exosortase B
VSAVASLSRWKDPQLAPWLLLLLGMAAMYVPSYVGAAGTLWQSDDFGHGPIILAVVLWLFWRMRWPVVTAAMQPLPQVGWLLFGVGLLLYAFGRTFTISSVEFASQIPVVAGALLVLRGPAALRRAWFPVFFLVFMVPLPASLVDTLTAPLKEWISFLVVDLLHAVGYPVARAGVIISVGPYQLLVADACSGLNSMVSLSALGVLFMYLMPKRSWLHNAVMLLAILPIAFASNIVRVVLLVLITYHLGDEAGQGFLHGAAGMVLMVAALATFFLLDVVLNAVLGSKRKPAARGS